MRLCTSSFNNAFYVTSRPSVNGLILIDVSDDEMFRGNKYSGSVYGELAGQLELCISVRVSARETKGILVIAHKEYISMLD